MRLLYCGGSACLCPAAFASSHCAYPRRDGQTELARWPVIYRRERYSQLPIITETIYNHYRKIAIKCSVLLKLFVLWQKIIKKQQQLLQAVLNIAELTPLNDALDKLVIELTVHDFLTENFSVHKSFDLFLRARLERSLNVFNNNVFYEYLLVHVRPLNVKHLSNNVKKLVMYVKWQNLLLAICSMKQ